MHFFSIEQTQNGQISIEDDDGAILQGSPDKVLPLLRQFCVSAGAELAGPRQNTSSGGSPHAVA